MRNILEKSDALQPMLVAWRRHIHQNPEVGMDTHCTSAYVKAELEKMGYAASYLADTGVVAVAGGKKPGKCFLLRADMDALPLQEETELPFKATNGCMHACGHDLHTAMLLGAAKLLKDCEDEIPGCVKLMFQPAEENLLGAKAMVEAGVLEAPKVDAAAMLHVVNGQPYPTGTIIVPPVGPFWAASDWYEISIKGKGGHGAMPQNTIDPLNVASHLYLALQTINSREVAAADMFVLTVGMVQGGTTFNIIPDTAVVRGTLRTYTKEVRSFIIERIQQIAQHVAQTFRAEAEVRMPVSCPAVENDENVTDICWQSLSAVFGDTVPRITERQSGSEDFSYVTQRVPSVTLTIAADNPQQWKSLPIHHPKVMFDEAILSRGAAAYVATALGWLQQNQG